MKKTLTLLALTAISYLGYTQNSEACTENISLLASSVKAKDIMSVKPKRIDSDAMAIDAMEVMEIHGISQLLVEENDNYAGVVHLHDLIKEGII